MPEMQFHVRWPDGSEQACYSPSSVIRDYLDPGTTYPLDQFLKLSRSALTKASDRVEAKYGYRCTSAAAQLAQIEDRGRSFADTPSAKVTCISISQGQ